MLAIKQKQKYYTGSVDNFKISGAKDCTILANEYISEYRNLWYGADSVHRNWWTLIISGCFIKRFFIRNAPLDIKV